MTLAFFTRDLMLLEPDCPVALINTSDCQVLRQQTGHVPSGGWSRWRCRSCSSPRRGTSTDTEWAGQQQGSVCCNVSVSASAEPSERNRSPKSPGEMIRMTLMCKILCYQVTAGSAKKEIAKTEKHEATILPIHVLGTVSPYPIVVTVIWTEWLRAPSLSWYHCVLPLPTTERRRSCWSSSCQWGRPHPSHWGTRSSWRRSGPGTRCRESWWAPEIALSVIVMMWHGPVCEYKPRSRGVSRCLPAGQHEASGESYRQKCF